MKAPMNYNLGSAAVLAVLILLVMVTGARSEADLGLETQLGSYGDWVARTLKDGGKTICYIGSKPHKEQGKYKKRDDTYVLITHRPADDPPSTKVLSVNAGYPYKNGSDVKITIGKQAFKLFTDGGHAFAKDSKTDNKLVKAMIRGTTMVVRGTSSRGTLTTDTYSLEGFTAAYKAINEACKV